MPDLLLPKRVEREKVKASPRSCPAHRAWVRKHHCCVSKCERLPIECAHVRIGDRWRDCAQAFGPVGGEPLLLPSPGAAPAWGAGVRAEVRSRPG